MHMDAELSQTQVAFLWPRGILTESTISPVIDCLDRIGPLTVLLEVGEVTGQDWRFVVKLQDAGDDLENWADLENGKFQPLIQGGAVLMRFLDADHCCRYLRAVMRLEGTAQMDVTCSVLGRQLLRARVEA